LPLSNQRNTPPRFHHKPSPPPFQSADSQGSGEPLSTVPDWEPEADHPSRSPLQSAFLQTTPSHCNSLTYHGLYTGRYRWCLLGEAPFLPPYPPEYKAAHPASRCPDLNSQRIQNNIGRPTHRWPPLPSSRYVSGLLRSAQYPIQPDPAAAESHPQSRQKQGPDKDSDARPICKDCSTNPACPQTPSKSA